MNLTMCQVGGLITQGIISVDLKKMKFEYGIYILRTKNCNEILNWF